MTEQEVNNLIDSKIGKTKMSQLPETDKTGGLYSIGYTGNQSVKFKAGLLQGDPLTVRKTYQTEAEALADKNPIDVTTSLPLTVGQFVSIVDDGEKNGIYRIGSISGDGTMSLELQGKLGDLSGYTKTGGSTKTTKDIDDEKADHGYTSLGTAKTLKEVDDDLVQLEGDVNEKIEVVFQFELGNIDHNNGELFEQEGRIRTEPIYFNPYGKIGELLKFKYTLISPFAQGNGYVYKGNTPVKRLSVLDNYYFSGGELEFTYDGTFDNFRFVLTKASAVTQEELDAHNVTSMIPPYIHRSEIGNYVEKQEYDNYKTHVENDLSAIKQNSYIPLVNRVINGNFKNSTENWFGFNVNLSASNNILTSTGNVYQAPVGSTNAIQNTEVPFTYNRTVYIKATARITDADCTNISLSFRNSSGNFGGYAQEVSVVPIQGEWHLLEAILSVPTSGIVETETSKIVVIASYPPDTIIGGYTLDVKNVMLLDLSSDFDVIPNLSDIQNLLSVYENEWFDGMVPQKTLKEIYDELISKLNMENTSMNEIMKQPKGTLQDWKKIEGTNSSAPYVVSPDGYLYFRQASKIKRIKDIENGTIEEGASWTIPNTQAMFAFPSGLIIVVNSGESPNGSIDVYKTSDFTVEPTLKASFPGRHSSGAFANSATYYGSNEILFIGVYDDVKGVMQADMHMSIDGGETFTKIKTTSGVDPNVNWHWHAAHYDPYMGRIWLSEGDGALGRGVWYSDDMGVTWERIESNEYQPTLITSFPNRVVFGRDGGKPGIYEWKRSKKLEDYGPITELDDALTFRPDLRAQETFPYSPYYNDGMEAYIMFTPTASPATMYYIFATGDGGESWHCVFSGLNGFRGPIKKDKFVVCRAREWGDFALWYCPALEWE